MNSFDIKEVICNAVVEDVMGWFRSWLTVAELTVFLVLEDSVLGKAL